MKALFGFVIGMVCGILLLKGFQTRADIVEYSTDVDTVHVVKIERSGLKNAVIKVDSVCYAATIIPVKCGGL